MVIPKTGVAIRLASTVRRRMAVFSRWWSARLAAGKHPFQRERRHKGRNIAAKQGDLFHKSRGYEVLALAGGQENRLDRLVQPGVHTSHLKFVVEIRHGAKPAHDDTCPHLARETDQQAVEGQ